MLARFSKCEMNYPEFTVIAVVIAARGTKTLFIITCTLVNASIFGNIFFKYKNRKRYS